MNVIPLVNKPYVNEVTLNEKPISKILLVLSIENMYLHYRGSDLSKEVLWVSLGQLAAKLEDDLIVRESNPGCTRVVRGGRAAGFFSDLQL